jgi:CheY-like chemotaxis protein
LPGTTKTPPAIKGVVAGALRKILMTVSENAQVAKETVLIVDDIRMDILQIQLKTGYVILLQIAEIWRIEIDKRHFDLIFLDLRMPGIMASILTRKEKAMILSLNCNGSR